MNSSSERHINSHSLLHPFSSDLLDIPIEKFKPKIKKSKEININNHLYKHQRKKRDLKYFEKYVHNYFIKL